MTGGKQLLKCFRFAEICSCKPARGNLMLQINLFQKVDFCSPLAIGMLLFMSRVFPGKCQQCGSDFALLFLSASPGIIQLWLNAIDRSSSLGLAGGSICGFRSPFKTLTCAAFFQRREGWGEEACTFSQPWGYFNHGTTPVLIVG